MPETLTIKPLSAGLKTPWTSTTFQLPTRGLPSPTASKPALSLQDRLRPLARAADAINRSISQLYPGMTDADLGIKRTMEDEITAAKARWAVKGGVR